MHPLLRDPLLFGHAVAGPYLDRCPITGGGPADVQAHPPVANDLPRDQPPLLYPLYRFKIRRMLADLGIDEAGYAAG